MVVRETLDGFQGGLQIGGRVITDTNIIPLATTEVELGVGGSPRPSQPQIQPTYQRRQDLGNGVERRERRHSVSHFHSE